MESELGGVTDTKIKLFYPGIVTVLLNYTVLQSGPYTSMY